MEFGTTAYVFTLTPILLQVVRTDPTQEGLKATIAYFDRLLSEESLSSPPPP